MGRDWAWALVLIAVTIAMHASGIALIAVALDSLRDRLQARGERRTGHVFVRLIVLISGVGLALTVLHGIEALLWAAAYWWVGALEAPQHAMLFSVDSMSTRGSSGLALEPGWRLMGALEATSGMLLFGISTAFLFAVMQAYWPILARHRQ